MQAMKMFWTPYESNPRLRNPNRQCNYIAHATTYKSHDYKSTVWIYHFSLFSFLSSSIFRTKLNNWKNNFTCCWNDNIYNRKIMCLQEKSMYFTVKILLSFLHSVIIKKMMVFDGSACKLVIVFLSSIFQQQFQ